MFSACLEFCLRTQIRLSAHPTRPCGFEAVHWPLQPLAAHADVPEVLPRRACLWRRALRQMCPGRAFWSQCRSGARTLSAPQDGPCGFYRQHWANKRMIALEAEWILRETSKILWCHISSVSLETVQYRLWLQRWCSAGKTSGTIPLKFSCSQLKWAIMMDWSVFSFIKGKKRSRHLNFFCVQIFFFSVLVLCELPQGIPFNHGPTTGFGDNTVGNPYLLMKYM